MFPFSLPFVAPVFQIIFSVIKLNGQIKLPSGIIAVLTFLPGIGLSIASTFLVASNIHPNSVGVKCGTISAAFLFVGFFITLVATPFIELIFFTVKKLKGKTDPTVIKGS